jgi:hypothetical protein
MNTDEWRSPKQSEEFLGIDLNHLEIISAVRVNEMCGRLKRSNGGIQQHVDPSILPGIPTARASRRVPRVNNPLTRLRQPGILLVRPTKHLAQALGRREGFGVWRGIPCKSGLMPLSPAPPDVTPGTEGLYAPRLKDGP